MAVKLKVLVTVLIFGMYFTKIALGQWSECSVSCGHGTRTRYSPFYGTEDCNNGCLNGGVLRNTHCDCSAGTTGPCCSDILECASNPCQNGGKCIEMINRYDCNCTRRYSGPNCENDLMWEHYSACQQEFKRCFRIFQKPLIWTGAQDFCTRRAGHLAVLDTTEKQYFLETSLKTLEIDEISSHFWIGASSNANALYWITGDAVVNTRWSPGVGHGVHGYHCLALSTQYSFMWTEQNCSSFAYFICEEGVDPIESILG